MTQALGRRTMHPAALLLARTALLGLGLIAFLWGILEFPLFWQAASSENVAHRILDGDPFKTEALKRQLLSLQEINSKTDCRQRALQSAAVIQLRLTESALSANGSADPEENLTQLTDAIKKSLSCSPADPFLWLALYYAKTLSSAPSEDDLSYLRLSYQLGPNEGWIALRRNAIAFAHFSNLPQDLADLAIDEFILLLKNNMTDQAAKIFIGPAKPEQDLLGARLVELSTSQRLLFTDALAANGYFKSNDSPSIH
jgi:hypothetical protein